MGLIPCRAQALGKNKPEHGQILPVSQIGNVCFGHFRHIGGRGGVLQNRANYLKFFNLLLIGSVNWLVTPVLKNFDKNNLGVFEVINHIFWLK